MKKSYIRGIKRYGWIVLACVLIAALAGLAMVKLQKQVYQVSSTMYVVAGAPSNGFNATLSTNDSIGLANNYATEIMSRSVMAYVYKSDPQLQKRGYAADDLLADVVTVPSATSSTFLITASALNAADAAMMANDVANGFQSYILSQNQQQLTAERTSLQNQQAVALKQKSAIEGQLEALASNADPHFTVYQAELNDIIHTLDTVEGQLLALPTIASSNAVVIQQATAKDATLAVKTNLILALSVGIGLLVGILIMLLVIYLNNLLWSEEQVSEQLRMSYLGGLSKSQILREKPAQAEGQVLKELSDVCANLRLTGTLPGQWIAPQGAVLLITSPRDVEGKSTIATALAATLARGGCQTLIVDGNLRRPSTHLSLGLRGIGIGLSDVLGAGSGLEQAMQRTTVPNLWFLPAGTPMKAPSLLLEQKLPSMLSKLRKQVDIVVLDGPSVLVGAEASVLASISDGVVLVVDSRHERLSLLKRAKEVLDSLAHVPVGLLLNRFSQKGGNSYYAFTSPESGRGEEWRAIGLYAGGSNGSGNGQTPQPVPVVVPSVSGVAPAKTSLFDYTSTPTSQSRTEPWRS